MTHPNLELINRFFEAYGKRDLDGVRATMEKNVQWIFPGHHPLSGTKNGVDEVLEFFDAMGTIMADSNIQVENLVTGVNDDYVVECQHLITRREDGNNLDHFWSILWTFRNGKIAGGRHLAGDQHAADTFFCKVY
jgi:ketosteroid isomerase-like protein